MQSPCISRKYSLPAPDSGGQTPDIDGDEVDGYDEGEFSDAFVRVKVGVVMGDRY